MGSAPKGDNAPEGNEDTDALVDDNFSWTFNYFALRLEMMDELFLIEELS